MKLFSLLLPVSGGAAVLATLTLLLGQGGAATAPPATTTQTPARAQTAAPAETIPSPVTTMDPKRIAAIADLLPATPGAPGLPPRSDRAAWAALAATEPYQAVLRRAEGLLTQPLPPQPDELFLEYSRNGNRTRFQNVANQRRGRLTPLVLAECMENNGRFLPAIEELVTALDAERTWMLPAHDAKLENFEGKTVDIDLVSSALAWNLGLADVLIGDRLKPEARQMLRDNARRRVLDPFRDMVTGKRPANWWLTTTNNWNAVCLAGVTGAALAEIPDRQDRALFVAAAERYSTNFLAGFTPDGYCSEGLGYWNYGFGHYVLLAETIRRATSNGLDLLALPAARPPATFGTRIQIVGGIAPAFADCAVFAKPSGEILRLVSRRLGLGLTGYESAPPGGVPSTLFETMVYRFDGGKATAAPPAKNNVADGASSPLRDWFGDAGILISRPAPNAGARLGVALKGGNNAEHHNHNDVGSFVVVVGDRPVLLDPGSETYTARTFSSRRYESKLLNSFGHPVPRLANTLQQTGAVARARILKTNFTSDADTITMDIASAYAVPDLTRLERTFTYTRGGAGALVVTDTVAFKSPQSYEGALLTLGSWQRQPDGSLLVYDVDQAVRVQIDTGGRAFTIEPEVIHEDAPVTPTRIGIRLTEPVRDATVTLTITPFTPPAPSAGGNLLPNGGFELGTFGWELPRGGMASLSAEQAAPGDSKTALKIQDDNSGAGSSAFSARLPVPGGTKQFVLRGKGFHESGSGLGMYVYFLDADANRLNPVDAAGNVAPVGTLATGAPGRRWEPFAFSFAAPPKTASLQLWIHSFNGARVTAYLDDLEVVPAESTR